MPSEPQITRSSEFAVECALSGAEQKNGPRDLENNSFDHRDAVFPLESPLRDFEPLETPLLRSEIVRVILTWAASIAAIFPEEFRSIQTELAQCEALAKERRELRRSRTKINSEEMQMYECRSRVASSRSKLDDALTQLDRMDKGQPESVTSVAALMRNVELLMEEVEVLTNEYQESTGRVRDAINTYSAARSAARSSATDPCVHKSVDM